ncbi:hypothetical protein [Zobellia uliginosa]|uniref:hypothetical protein n=1 Tax=Zobellia uliginosa TaxID=143224 RepID=UPI0026E19490|nr:hypothetical protein [Zobellia uliginosa]MDO6516073.1 hypothetical protein [Zobellia uliginosa]
MKKYFVYLLCTVFVSMTLSCSKDEKEPDLINGEAKISNETGLSFVNSQGFTADHVTFKLRHGTNAEKEYGQSLDTYSYTELEEGPRTIYQIKVFAEGEEIPYSAYTIDAEGHKKEIKSTSIVEIKKNEVFKIFLEEAS